MIFPIKSEQEMLEEMMADLQAKTGINDFSPGSIARSLLEVINKKLHTAYKDLDIYASMIFLSHSTGSYLDLIGKLFNCSRDGDTDENYRYRIANQVFTAATANKTALRLKCLSIPRVKDVIFTEYTSGSGSFTVHVITDEIDTPDEVIKEVEEVINAYKAHGIKAIVTKPRPVAIDLEFSITLTNKGKYDSVDSITSELESKIQDYIDSIGLGASISLQKIISIVSLHNSIDQVFLSSFKVGDEDVTIRDKYNLEWDERAYIRNIKINII